MEEKELLIKKNPYMALSPNLMEYFSIIGYKESFVPKILDSFKKKKNEYKPMILSSIIPKSDYGLVDNKLIISQVYPENPIVIFNDKNNPLFEPPSATNMIYSFCFDSQDGKEKIFYVCFAYKFYEKYKYYTDKNTTEEYYIPKAFCIISQYYYFSTFKYICQNVLDLINDKNNIMPLEIVVYNIVNFTPSPIHCSLELDLFGYAHNNESKYRIIKQMSGYPYLEFDLSEVFNLLPLNLVLEIYLLFYLELSIIFFCSNLELLNIIMFIMFVLNYPCNDSPYYWHIVSVSQDNFKSENQFVGKFMVSFVGCNCAYTSEFDTTPFGKCHYIVDIDNKKCFIKTTDEFDEENDAEELKSMENIQSFIQNIIKENRVESAFVKNYVLKLKKNLESILTKNPEFSYSPKNKYVDFFKHSNTIMNNNKKIQEYFYNFNLSILMILFQDYSLNNSFDSIQKDEQDEADKKIMRLVDSNEYTDITKEESLFLKMYRNSSKYALYFENFIRNFEAIDVFSLSLHFSEEFINEKIKFYSDEINDKISLFKIIDLFFFAETSQIIFVSLNYIYSIYQERLLKYFEHFNKHSNIKKKTNQLITFNKHIINRYMELLNNHIDEEELLDIFPYLKVQLSNTMSYINRNYLVETIIEYLENKKDVISTYDLLVFSSVYMLIISISLHSEKKMVKYIYDIINTLRFAELFTRYHIYTMIKTFYKYYLIHGQKEYNSIKKYLLMLVNFLKDRLIIPNEEMLKLLNSFFREEYKDKNKEEINETILNESENKEDDKNIDLEKDNKDILCFMKYCFTEKKMFKPSNMVNVALGEYNVCNIVIKTGQKNIQPLVAIKIKKYSDSAKFFSPKKIYKFAKSLYYEFYNKYELDISKLNVTKIRECIINLIIYGIVLDDDHRGLIPLDLLINTLYLLKDFNDLKPKPKESNIIINDDKNVVNEKKEENNNNNIVKENKTKDIINEKKEESNNIIIEDNKESNVINEKKEETNNIIIEENKATDK